MFGRVPVLLLPRSWPPTKGASVGGTYAWIDLQGLNGGPNTSVTIQARPKSS